MMKFANLNQYILALVIFLGLMVWGYYYFFAITIYDEDVRGKFNYIVIASPLENESLVVGPHVVRYVEMGSLVIGFNIPVYMFECNETGPRAAPMLIGFIADSEQWEVNYYENIDEFKLREDVVEAGLVVRSIDDIVAEYRNGHLMFDYWATRSGGCTATLIDLPFWTGEIGDRNFGMTWQHRWMFSPENDARIIRRGTDDYWLECLENGYTRGSPERLCDRRNDSVGNK